MFLTQSEIAQLKLTAQSAYTALELVEDATCGVLDRVLCALTSQRAVAGYKALWAVCQLAYLGCVLGWLLFVQWAERFVSACQVEPVTPTDSDEDEFADLLAIPATPQPVDFSGCKVHQLRSLGVVMGCKGARRWGRDQAVRQLAA